MITVDIVNQLFPNIVTVIVQLCSTLVLFLVAKKFLWKSVKNWMNVRAEKMQADLSVSQKAKEEAMTDRSNAKEELAAASRKSEAMIEAAVKQAGQEKESILEEARRQASAEKQKAHAQIEAERVAMYDSMKKEMVDIALDAAAKLIGDKNTDEMDRQAIEAFVNGDDHGK